VIDEFKALPIWKLYEKKTLPLYNLNNFISEKLALLDHYYTAFPRYTLHNRQHQKNILKIIGELLGDDLEKLSALELAIIILITVLHDIGMVFSIEKLKSIHAEPTFTSFLNENYKAKLIFEESNEVLTEEIAEWYCRWMHAKRVWSFLSELENLKWKTVSLKTHIGNICESHNTDANTLLDDEKFKTDFLGEADLRFCAVLLRIADILDFDNTRSPKSVYEFLELDQPKNKNEQIGKDEWDKHLSSDGFKIGYNIKQLNLTFIAGPSHPQIEENIQLFLNTIEDELKKSSGVINKCSDRWREFKLPLSIDRSNIISQNYKKGSFRISLDENKIISLLTGESLYDNDFIFIRELLQNAIDTSRMRCFRELSEGNHSFNIKPIEISTWIDDEGYRWVRVDDFGMGINEYIVKNHLLKKGSSYYTSDYFKIQKLYFQNKTTKEFTPISRFGIGLLSCFILGDAVEITSYSVSIAQTNSDEEQIRLSIQNLQGQFILQTAKDKHDPLQMPNKFGFNHGYRAEKGTSIAVRINRAKDFLRFEHYLKDVLNFYVLCSPIDIIFEGEKLGYDFKKTLSNPFAQESFYPFNREQKNEIAEFINKNITSEIGINFLPVDLNNISTSNLQGQILFIRLKCDELNKTFMNPDFSVHFRIGKLNESMKLEFRKKFKIADSNKEEEKSIELDISEFFNKAVNLDIHKNLFSSDRSFYNENKKLHLIHNGITVPNYTGSNSYSDNSKLSFKDDLFFGDHFSHNLSYTYFGLIYFQDQLIPDLSVARNAIKSFPFSLYSSFFYATRKLNNHITKKAYCFDYLKNISENFSLEDVMKDELVKNDIWNNEKIIRLEDGLASISETKSRLPNGEIKVFIQRQNPFINSLVKGLIAINFIVELVIENDNDFYLLLKSIKEKSTEILAINTLTPLTFIPFNNNTNILCIQGFINQNHWLGKWVLSNQNIIINKFFGYFSSLMRHIYDQNYELVNGVVEHFIKVLPEQQKKIMPTISEDDFPQQRELDLPF
jgi:hypothetical protein